MAITIDISSILESADGKRYSAYRAGDAPVGGGTDLSQIFYSNNFEGGTNGVVAGAETGFADIAGAVYDNTMSYTGSSQSLKDTITVGTDANGLGWRHWLDWDNIKLGVGDEMWLRFDQFLEAGFELNVSGGAPSVKWVGMLSNSGTSRTYINPMDSASQVSNDWYFDAEGQAGEEQSNLTAGSGLVLRGVWQRWEFRVKPGKTNDGEITIWLDGVRVANLTGINNLASAATHFRNIHFQLFWNGGAPKTQTMWIDNWAVAIKSAGTEAGAVARDDTVYMATDAHGNPFIGSAT